MPASPICIIDPTQGNSTSRIMGFLSSIDSFCSKSTLASVIRKGVNAFNLTVEEDCTVDNTRAEELTSKTSLCFWSKHDRGATFSGSCSKLYSNLNDAIVENIKDQCPGVNTLTYYIAGGVVGGAVFLLLAYYGGKYIRNRFNNNANNRPNADMVNRGHNNDVENGRHDEEIPLLPRP